MLYGEEPPVQLGVLGDAAQQVNPIHGGGISLAMRAGVIAAQVGAKAIKANDVSAARPGSSGSCATAAGRWW